MNNADSRTILVTGATGQQGGAVTRQLLEEGFNVRIMTRNPDQPAVEALKERGAEVVVGDFDDADSLQHALEGVDGAFSVQNLNMGIDTEERWGIAFADAAKSAGIEHFVYTSVGSADGDTGIPHFESKWRIEEHVREIGLPATILRPVFFMENWRFNKESVVNGQLPLALSPDTKLQQIATEDIGKAAAQAFGNPEKWIGQSVELAGDEMTMEETARALGKQIGKEVTYTQIPWDVLQGYVGEEMTTMYRWFEDVGYSTDIDALRSELPELQSFESFLQNADEWK